VNFHHVSDQVWNFSLKVFRLKISRIKISGIGIPDGDTGRSQGQGFLVIWHGIVGIVFFGMEPCISLFQVFFRPGLPEGV